MYFVIKDNNIIAYTDDTEKIKHLSNMKIVENTEINLEQVRQFGVDYINNTVILNETKIIGEPTPSKDVSKSPIEILQKENMLLKERILQLEVAEVNRTSREIEKQIMGGI